MNFNFQRNFICCVIIFLLLLKAPLMPVQTAKAEASDGSLRSKIAQKLSLKLSGTEQMLIEPCMHSLEKRMPAFESKRIYSLIWAEMEADDDKQDADLRLLCWHILLAISEPTEINQGYHNTCALAALESYLAVTKPSFLCEFILEARKGHLILPSGRLISLPEKNISPDREARSFRPGGALRSYACQLFQIAAANAYWQSQRADPRGIKVPEGSIEYVQDNPCIPDNCRDTGERLFIHWSNNVREQVIPQDAIWPGSSPSMTMEAIDKTYRLLSGANDAPQLFAHRSQNCGKPINCFNTETQLKRKLQHLKESNKFPAIVSICMYGTQANAAASTPSCRMQSLEPPRPRSDWHVVCITDYNPNEDKVAIDNFWGPKSDHLAESMISLHTLYSNSFPATGKESNLGRVQFKTKTGNKSRTSIADGNEKERN